METNKPTPSHAIDYYLPLLQRYARFIIKDEEAAAALAKKVLKDQSDVNGLIPVRHLRQVLKLDLLNRCFYWMQSQIFDRPLVEVSVFKYAKPAVDMDENENPLSN